MHVCVRKLTIIGSDSVLSPGRRQAIIQASDEVLFIRPLGTNFSEYRNLHIFILEDAFENVVWKMAAILSQPQCVKTWITTVPADDPAPHSAWSSTCGALTTQG